MPIFEKIWETIFLNFFEEEFSRFYSTIHFHIMCNIFCDTTAGEDIAIHLHKKAIRNWTAGNSSTLFLTGWWNQRYYFLSRNWNQKEASANRSGRPSVSSYVRQPSITSSNVQLLAAPPSWSVASTYEFHKLS